MKDSIRYLKNQSSGKGVGDMVDDGLVNHGNEFVFDSMEMGSGVSRSVPQMSRFDL